MNNSQIVQTNQQMEIEEFNPKNYRQNQINVDEQRKQDADKIVMHQQLTLIFGSQTNYPPPSVKMNILMNNPAQALSSQILGKDNQLKFGTQEFYAETPTFNKQTISELFQQSDDFRIWRQNYGQLWADQVNQETSDYNKSTKNKGFGVAFVQDFENYYKNLQIALYDVGFIHYTEIHSILITIINIISRSEEENERPFYKRLIHGSQNPLDWTEENSLLDDQVLEYFFSQTFDYKLSQESVFPRNEQVDGYRELDIFINDSISGQLDEPSLKIDLSLKTFDRDFIAVLKKFFDVQSASFGEIEFSFGQYNILTGDPQNQNNKLFSQDKQQFFEGNNQEFLDLLNVMPKMVDAITLRGSIFVDSQGYQDSEQYIDRLLKSISDKAELCQEIQKIDISYNYISQKTFDLLAIVIFKSKLLNQIDISGCQIGNYIKFKTKTIQNYTQQLNFSQRCAQCCHGSLKCHFICCPCQAPEFLDTEQMRDQVIQLVKSDSQLFLQSFTKVSFEQLGEALSQVQINKFVANRLRFSSMATTNHINQFLLCLGNSQPIAVSLRDSGLQDIHLEGIIDIIQKSSRIMHMDLRLINLGQESYNLLNRMVQSSPFLISFPLCQSKFKIDITYQQYHTPKEQENQDMHPGLFGLQCCCFPFYQQTFSQKITPEQIQIKQEDVSIYIESIKKEVRHHRILTKTQLLAYMQNDQQTQKQVRDILNCNSIYKRMDITFSENQSIYLADWVLEMKGLFFRDHVEQSQKLEKVFNLDQLIRKLVEETNRR